MSEFAVRLPDREETIGCASEAEVTATLEEFRARHPGTHWAGVSIHEMRPGSTVGTERSVYDFIN